MNSHKPVRIQIVTSLLYEGIIASLTDTVVRLDTKTCYMNIAIQHIVTVEMI